MKFQTSFYRVAVSKLAIFLTMGLGLMASSCGKQAGPPPDPPAFPVGIQVARSVPINDVTEYVATLKSRDSAVIMPEVDGRVTQIYVRSGERVSQGTPLMQIDPAKQQAAVKSQEDTRTAQLANLKFAQQQYERTSGLFAAGVVSKQDLDQTKMALDAAQAQLRALDAAVQQQQVQLHYYKVLAPMGGIVGDIPVRVGDRVTSSTLLTTVDKPGSLEVYVYVPVERSLQLKIGLPMQIVDSAGKVIAENRITFVSPQVDNTTQTLLVKALIANNNDRLRTAQFIRARIIWGTQQSPVVPVLAVSRIGGQYFVFVAEEQSGKFVARQKPLRVGEMVGNDYVVLDGIKSGDKVIVSGTQFLVDGMPVMPKG